MATAYTESQFFTTTLSKVGGLNASQTTGIVLQAVSGIFDTSKPGVALLNYADPLSTSTAEWVTFTNINSTTKTLVGVTRGAEGFSAKTHDNGVVVAFPHSISHINNLAAALAIGGSYTNIPTGVLDEDDMATNSAVKLATQQSIKAYVDGKTNTDGWIADSSTWTYASAQTFTVSGDVTVRFRKGTKLKFTQTTAKYAVVVNSSYGAPNTTVTILTNTSHTIANAAITTPYYSYQEAPQGYPDWFAIAAPTFTVAEFDNGAGAQPTTSELRGKVVGSQFIAHMRATGTKAGAGTYFSWTNSGLPAIANSTERSLIGNAFVWNSGGTPDHFLGVISRVSTADYFLSDASMSDNLVINSAGFLYTYEI